MRPTNNTVQQFGVAQEAQVPTVGRQVTAAPVQFAADESKFRQLELLRNQLSTFNQGQAANAQLQDKLLKQEAQMQAEMDFAKDPSKFDAQAGNGYYYMHGMDLMGEAEAVKMTARAQAKANELLANPEALRGTDVNQFIEGSLAEEMQGVSDPIVARHLNKEASKLRQLLLPALAKAQQGAEEQYRRDTSHFIFSERADTPDNTRAYLQSDFPTMVSRLGKEGALEVVAGVLSTKVAEAQTADEAAGWLAMFGTKVPGTAGPDGKPMSLAQVGGERLAGSVSKLRQSVQTLKDAEDRALARQQQEAAKEAAKALKEEQDENFAQANRLLSKAYDPSTLAAAVNRFQGMSISDQQRRTLEWEATDQLAKMKELEKAGMEDPVALTKEFANLVSEGNWQNGVEWTTKTLSRLRSSSDTTAPRALVSGLFKDVSAMQVELGTDGVAKLSAHNEALLGVYSSIANDPDLVSFIPEKDQRYLRTLTNKMQEHGDNLALALRDTKAVMSRPIKPIPREAMQSVVESLLDKTVSKKMFGDYDDVSAASQQTVRQWAYEAFKDLSELDYPTADEQKKALDTKFNNEFVVLSSGTGPWRTTDVLYVGPNASKGYAVEDENGRTVQRTFNETDVLAAWKQLRPHMESKGYKDVSIQPMDHYTGDHVISAKLNGSRVQMPMHVTQLNEAAYRLAKEEAAGLNLEVELRKPTIAGGPIGTLVSMGSALGNVMGGSTQAPSSGVVAKFYEQLQLGRARQDVSTSVQAIPNSVAGAAQKQVKADIFNAEANALKVRKRQ